MVAPMPALASSAVSPVLRLLIGLGLVFGALTAAGPARPCSLVEGPEPGLLPAPGSTTGPLPALLAAVGIEPTLVRFGDPEGTPIPLVPDETLASLFIRFQLTRAWRPAAPLPSGQYRFMTGFDFEFPSDTSFFVDAALAPEVLTLSDVTLLVTLDEPESPGCGSFTSCDDVDFTKLELSFPSTVPTDTFRLEIRNPKTGRRRLELVALPGFGSPAPSILVWDNPQRFPGSFKRDELCLSLTPISEDGTLGTLFDLGCFDPNRRGDPRILDQRGGCSTGHAGELSMLMWLVAVLALRARRPAIAGHNLR